MLLFAPGPSLLGYSAAYLLKHPEERSGPYFVIAVSLVLIAGTSRFARRARRKKPRHLHLPILVAHWAGLILGLVLFAMTLFILD